MRTNNPSKVLIVFLSLFFVSLPLSGVNAHETEEWKQYQACVEAKGSKELQINSANDDLQQFVNFRRDIEGWLADNAEDQRTGVRSSLINAGFGDIGAATSALVESAFDTMDGIKLLGLFNSANASISAQNGVISGLYTDPPNTPKENRTGYDAVYDRYVDAYNNLSASDKAKIRHARGEDGPYPKMNQPSGSTYGLVACARPSNLSPTCYGYYKDADEHKETCSLKHGTSGETNVTWWSCFDSQCHRYPEHWVPCRATNCNVLFPPPTRRVYSVGYDYAVIITYHDHEVTCGVDVYSFWNPFATCPEKYFTCVHSRCPKWTTHMSGATPPPPPPPPPDDTPNCPDCTNHCSSPCGCSNSGTCNGSVASPPPPPTPPTAPSDNTPNCSYCTDGCSSCQSPATVYCARAACAAEVSDRLEHRVENCTNCGATYWTCYPGAVDRHTTPLTCKRSDCGASLTRCQNGPGKCINGGYHWL